MLKMNVEKLDDRTILHLEGRVVNGVETTTLRRSVLSHENSNTIVLDFARVSGIDARGLGVLLELREWALSKGINFSLTNVSRLIQQVFEITCLNSVFDISALNVSASGPAARTSRRAQKDAKLLVSNLRRFATS
jgi:anti-anti-sigma factor